MDLTSDPNDTCLDFALDDFARHARDIAHECHVHPHRADTLELAQITGRFAVDPMLLSVSRGDPDATSAFAVDVAAAFAEPTEEVPAMSFEDTAPERGAAWSAQTVEQTLFDEPLPLPPPSHGDPAYFVEVRPPHGAPSLLAVRATLDDAVHVALTVHPSAADVTIRELALPCDADALARADRCRTWTRRPDGTWLFG